MGKTIGIFRSREGFGNARICTMTVMYCAR